MDLHTALTAEWQSICFKGSIIVGLYLRMACGVMNGPVVSDNEDLPAAVLNQTEL